MGDLLGGQPPEQTEGKGDPSLRRDRRVASGEHQPQQVVAYVVIHRFGDPGFEASVRFEPTTEHGNLVGEAFVSAITVDGPPLGHSNEPGTGLGGNS